MTIARILIRPPSRPSNGALTLRRALGDVARVSRRNPVPRQYRHVINWGNPTEVTAGAASLYNKPSNVAAAIEKINALTQLRNKGVRVPKFWVLKEEVARDGIVLARSTTRGSGGRGITVIRQSDALPDAPLYVAYVRKTSEYRIHVAFGKVIFVQIKLRPNNSEMTNDQRLIRNHAQGWVFGPRDIDSISEDVMVQSIKAVEALDLDFGAVDVIVGKSDNLAYVLEVNTAPGLHSPGLVEAYKQAFMEKLNV